MAGYDTTAATLSWVAERLVRHPEVLHRLEETLADGDDTYLDAVITETLRLRPTVPFTVRAVNRDVVLNDVFLPRGSVVFLYINGIHRRGDLYDDADEFRPERSLGTTPDPYHWLPFDDDIDRSLGGHMAMFEARVLLRTILQEMTFDPETSTGENQQAQTILLLPKKRATVTLRKRTDLAAKSVSGDERVPVRVTVDPQLCLETGYLAGRGRAGAVRYGRRWNSTTRYIGRRAEECKVGRSGFPVPDGSNRGDARDTAGMSFRRRISSLSIPRIWSSSKVTQRIPRSEARVRACGLISCAAKIPRTGASTLSRLSSSKVAAATVSTPSISPRRLISTATERPCASRHQQVDRADGRHVLAPHQGVSGAQQLDVFGQQRLQVGLDAVLDQPRVNAEVMVRVVFDVFHRDAQLLAGVVLDHPHR